MNTETEWLTTENQIAAERERLATDVHTGIAQSITALTLGLALVRSATEADAVLPAEILERLEDLATRSGSEVRRLLAILRTGTDQGLAPALRMYVEEIETPGSPVSLTVAGRSPGPQLTDRTLRFVHGALGVIGRRAPRGPVGVTAVAAEGSVTVRITAPAGGIRDGRPLEMIARDAEIDPLVVRTTSSKLSIEGVVR